MQTRVAKCGHEYTVPDGVPGRRRNRCDGCAVREDPLAPEKRKRRAEIAAARKQGYEAPRQWRKARCGHLVPWHPGPNSRTRCDDCTPTRFCPTCGEDISDRRLNVKYCTKWCGEIASGARLPEPLPLRTCALEECDVVFRPIMKKQRCCCEHHGKIHSHRKYRADGKEVPVPWNDRRRDGWHRRRALQKGASTGKKVDLAEIAERDRWLCHICRKRVGKKLKWPHSRSASLDHIIPLTEDGSLHDPLNVRLAHLGCNSRKGNRGGGEQLLLIG